MSHTLKNGAELHVILCSNNEHLGLGQGVYECEEDLQWEEIYACAQYAENACDAIGAITTDNDFRAWNGGKFVNGSSHYRPTQCRFVRYWIEEATDEDGNELDLTEQDETEAEAIAEAIAREVDIAHYRATA